MRVQYVHIESLHHRARAALALASRGSVSLRERRSLIRRAGADAAMIEREDMPWGNALATLVRAGIAACRSQRDVVPELLVSAERRFRATGMVLYAAAAQRLRGQCLASNAGDQLVSAADTAMRKQDVRNPERLTHMLGRGFSRSVTGA